MNGRTVPGLWMVLCSAIFLLDGLLPRIVMATHEADHRFTVYGYVRDDHGRPIKGERVIVVDTRLDAGNTAFTDGDGYYETLIHLHNEDLGDEIVVMVKDQRKTIRATFDPEDLRAERKVQVDFGATEGMVQTQTPVWIYGVGALILVGLFVTIRTIRQNKRKQRRSRKGS